MLQCMRVNFSHRYVQESMHTSVDPNKCSREDILITHQSLNVDPSQQLLYCIMNEFWFHDLYIFETVFGNIYICIYSTHIEYICICILTTLIPDTKS